MCPETQCFTPNRHLVLFTKTFLFQKRVDQLRWHFTYFRIEISAVLNSTFIEVRFRR